MDTGRNPAELASTILHGDRVISERVAIDAPLELHGIEGVQIAEHEADPFCMVDQDGLAKQVLAGGVNNGFLEGGAFIQQAGCVSGDLVDPGLDRLDQFTAQHQHITMEAAQMQRAGNAYHAMASWGQNESAALPQKYKVLKKWPSENSISIPRLQASGLHHNNNAMMKVYVQSPAHTQMSNQSQQSMVITPQSSLLDPSLSYGPGSWAVVEQKSGNVLPKPKSEIKSERSAPKTRWKPNASQLCLLEQHFNSGYTKPTQELFAAVAAVGPATEAQVAVWLKNRLSRSKTNPGKGRNQGEGRGSSHGDDGESASHFTGVKRPLEEDESWEDFGSIFGSIVDELTTVAASIEQSDVLMLAQSIREARRICCFGVGREGLVMRAFAANLHHLGFECYCVGDTNMPTMGCSDLVLVSAGPSHYSSVSALALEAMRACAKVIAFTSHKTAELPFAERVIRIPSQTLPPCMPMANSKVGLGGADVVSFLPKGKWSIMQMGACYEISLWLMLECVSVMLRKKMKVQASAMRARQANLT